MADRSRTIELLYDVDDGRGAWTISTLSTISTSALLVPSPLGLGAKTERKVSWSGTPDGKAEGVGQ